MPQQLVLDNQNMYSPTPDSDFRLRRLVVTDLEVTGNRVGAVAAYSASGAVEIRTGIAQITAGSAAAMTLAAPTALQEGTVITFDSTTAFAHTLTVAGGLRGAGASADVGTFGAAIGNGVTLYAKGLFWWPIPGSNLNVTFA